MSGPTIALFANRGSAQLAALADVLVEQGAVARQFDIQLTGAGQTRIAFGPDRLTWDGIDFAEIRAVHIRCTAPNVLPLLPPVLNQASHSELRSLYFREQECNAAAHAFFNMLARRGAVVVNPLTSAYLDHNAKAQLYAKLAGHGISVPRTLTTNDPQAALEFIAEVGEVVAKPQIGIGSTRLVTAEDQQRFHELRYGPVMFQERIVGPTVRVHIVGDTVVLALRILNDAIDSRTETQGFEFYRLPNEACRELPRANRLLGLHYAAWDVIVTADGRYYALDCNPGPFIMWIGPDYVRVVFTELARYLIACAEGASTAEASARVRAYRSAA